MLNELYSLASALERSGIQPAESHRALRRPGSALDALWVRLDETGSVASVEHLPGSRLATLWTLGDGNQNWFPFVKPKQPVVVHSPDAPLWAELEVSRRARDPSRVLGVLSQLGVRESAIGKRGMLEFLSSLRAAVEERRRRLVSAGSVEVVVQVHERYLKATADEQRCGHLVASIASLALSQASGGHLPIDLVRGFLVGKRKREKSGIVIQADCALYFDIWSADDPSASVTAPGVSELLTGALTATEHSGAAEVDSLTGDVGILLHDEPFPVVNLKIIGATSLFSMFEAARCQFRYRRTGSEIFPTARTVAQRLAGALEWATRPERRGVIWSAVPSGKTERGLDGKTREKKDLLIAYAERQTDASGPLAELFAGPSTHAAVFDETCRQVFEALSGHLPRVPDARIRLIVLRKADPARRQVVLARALTVEQVLAASAEWRTAARNHPRFVVPMPAARGEKALRRQPVCPYPGAVVTALQRQWFRSGADSALVAGCTWRDGLDLFTEPSGSPSGVAPRLLALAVMRWAPLLIGLSQARRIGAEIGAEEKAWKPFKVDARESALRAVALLGILLFKVGRTKEAYVDDAMYTVGQLLSLADLLHLEYCRKRRRGDVPNQLIGNALIPAAAESPTRAVARLLDRLRVYQAWAQTARESNPGELRLARWALGRLGDVSTRLHDVSLPVLVSDAGKAELLLGYLAGAARETGDPQNEPTPETEVTTDGN